MHSALRLWMQNAFSDVVSVCFSPIFYSFFSSRVYIVACWVRNNSDAQTEEAIKIKNIPRRACISIQSWLLHDCLESHVVPIERN